MQERGGGLRAGERLVLVRSGGELVGAAAETPACHGSRQRHVAKLELTMSLPRLVAVWDRDLTHATYGAAVVVVDIRTFRSD